MELDQLEKQYEEEHKQQLKLDKNKKVIKITLFILLIFLILIFGRLLLMLAGIM